MVRYLKAKLFSEEKNSSSPSLSESQPLTRSQKVSETLKIIPETISVQESGKEQIPKENPEVADFPQNQGNILSSILFEEEYKKKIDDLESKLKDYEEYVRKKETSAKLALKLKQEESDQPHKKKSIFFKSNSLAVKRYKKFLKKYLSGSRLLIFLTLIVAVLMLAFVFIMMARSSYELTVDYRLVQNKGEPDQQMVNRLSAYLTSTPMLTKIIEQVETFKLDKNVHQKQLEAWLKDYRRRIRIYPDPEQNLIKLTAQWSDPQKAALVVRKITETYTQLINIQESLNDYYQYLIKAIEKQSVFKTRDKMVLLNVPQKVKVEQIISKKQIDLKTRMENLEKEFEDLKNSLPGVEEQKYLSGILKPQTVEDYIVLGLKSRLFDLEAESFIAEITDGEIILNKNYSAELTQSWNQVEKLIKSQFKKDLSADENQKLALVMKKMMIEVKKEVLLIFLNGQYGLSESFSINQKEYLVNQKNINKILENYAYYITSKDSLSKTLDSRFNEDAKSNVRKPNEAIHEKRRGFMLSLFFILLSGIALIYYKRIRKSEIPM